MRRDLEAIRRIFGLDLGLFFCLRRDAAFADRLEIRQFKTDLGRRLANFVRIGLELFSVPGRGEKSMAALRPSAFSMSPTASESLARRSTPPTWLAISIRLSPSRSS